MKQKIKWIALAALLVSIVVAAPILYKVFIPSGGGVGAISTGEETRAATGQRLLAPDFTVLDEEGNTVRLSDFRGKPVVVNFWATWCYYCRAEMPDFERARLENPDVVFLMVNATDGVWETKEGALGYVRGEGFGFSVLFDTESSALHAYEVAGFPATFFVNEEGVLVARGSEMLDRETLQKGIDMIKTNETAEE